MPLTARHQTTGLTREQLEREEDGRLAAWAIRSFGAGRAVTLDREGRLFDYRTEFQRDRDRILHARAFRRLRLRSHGGALPPSERYRDRLTHTLEVSQLSRTVARGLGLNEDLVEAIALGHELGMPPFGRGGEAALDLLLAGPAGGFRYPEQSLRVVDSLEKRYPHAGLNLTAPTREGILKHVGGLAPAGRGQPGAPDEDDALSPDLPAPFETQVVAAVDEAASAVQDLDDGLRAGEVDPAEVESLPIVRELLRRIAPPAGTARKGHARGGLHMRANTINRGLTHMMVTGIIHQSRRALKSWARANEVDSYDAFLRARARIVAGTVGLTPAARRLYDGLAAFVARSLHQGAWMSGVAARARHVLGGLFRAVADDPRLAEDYLLLRFKELEGGPFLRDVPPAGIEAEIARRYRGNVRWSRLVVDHIAGMTDPYALAEYERLLGPFGMVRS
ncbi:MAG TPA: HD domain-containing protein [Candidatus Polarisedimenticolia bacterium]|nr:HD domain-containing protein [Candidatus Polarisedimenticolia bacterium]